MPGIDLMTALKRTEFMWFPIKQDTNYATTKFTGSLALGVDLNAVLVMPEILRSVMKIPKEAAISYNISVTEVLDQLKEAVRNPAPYKTALLSWTHDVWNSNMTVLQNLLT
jgi:hypothetical protein